MATTTFDIDALKEAFEAHDVERVLEFYSSDIEHLEIDDGAPPKSPCKTDIEYIRGAIQSAGQAGVRLHLDNPVVGTDRAPARSPASSRTVGGWSPTRSTT